MFSSRDLAVNRCPVKHDELPVCTSKISNDLRANGEKKSLFFWIKRKNLTRLKREMIENYHYEI